MAEQCPSSIAQAIVSRTVVNTLFVSFLVSSMPENFLISASALSDLTVSEPSQEELPNRESLRLLIIGSRQGVTGMIQTLHRLRFAEVGEWSPLLPGPNPGEVMSILTRHLLMT
jgi:hypothetical protein